MGLMLLSVAWLALACIVLGFAAYRKLVAYGEDDNVHLRAVDGPRIEQQKAVANRVEFADRWGRILTVVTIVYGIGIAAAYLYHQWILSYQLVP